MIATLSDISLYLGREIEETLVLVINIRPCMPPGQMDFSSGNSHKTIKDSKLGREQECCKKLIFFIMPNKTKSLHKEWSSEKEEETKKY